MSKWCPKCQKMSQNETKCDFCGHTMKETSNKNLLLKHILEEISDENKTINNQYQDKKTRGAIYEAYIAEHYRDLGYSVTEHGKENGLKDDGIDLIAKKDNEVILIQCKDWNENNSHKIDHKDIKVLRVDTYDFLEKHPVFKTYKIKMRYTLSGNFIATSAKKHMDACKDDISYEIIKPTYRNEEQTKTDYTETLSYKKKSKQNRSLEIIIIVIVAILVILFFLKPGNETKQVNDTPNKDIISTTETDNTIKKEIQEKHKVEEAKKENARIKKFLAAKKAEREKDEKEQEEIIINKKSIEQKNIPIIPYKKETREDAKRKLLQQMKLDPTQVSVTADKESEREKAKKGLLEQMQN